jgi:hypothetical protein
MQNIQTGKLTNNRAARWGAIFALAIGLAAAPNQAAAAPQDAAQQGSTQQTPTPQASTPQASAQAGDVPVHMVVTVEPRKGGQAPALSPDDVKVFQRNNQDPVTSWVPLQGDRAGLQLFILIDDNSRSILGLQFSDIAKFILEQPASTAIGVGYMRNGTVFTVQNMTTDHALAAKSLRLPIGPGASTSPYLSLADLMKRWPETSDRREILMLTSGNDPLGGGFSNDPFTNPYLQTAVDHAQEGGFIVYSIYFPSGVGGGGRGRGRGGLRTTLSQTGLDVVSQRTGGQAYYLGFGAPVNIAPYLQDVSERLKHQYGLTFMAKSTNKPRLEPVKVKTETPNTSLITAEEGYVKTGM